MRPGTKVVESPVLAHFDFHRIGQGAAADGFQRVQRQEMIGAQPVRPLRKTGAQLVQNNRTRRQFRGMALAIIEAHRLHAGEARQRPGQADGLEVAGRRKTAGGRLFFPWGARGGYTIASEQDYVRLRRQVNVCSIITLSVTILLASLPRRSSEVTHRYLRHHYHCFVSRPHALRGLDAAFAASLEGLARKMAAAKFLRMAQGAQADRPLDCARPTGHACAENLRVGRRQLADASIGAAVARVYRWRPSGNSIGDRTAKSASQFDRICTSVLLASIGGRGSAMSPKEIHSLVLDRAKHGALIDRCARIVFWIALSVGIVCSMPSHSLPFVPPEYFMVIYLGVPSGLLLLALALLVWLKWRLVTDEEMPRQSLSAWFKEVPGPPVEPAPKNSD